MPVADPPIAALILAAGMGTRMKSALPKVLHPLLGRPLVSYPIEAAQTAGASRLMIVLGHGAEQVRTQLQQDFPQGLDTTIQAEQRGTGDATRCGVEALGAFSGYFLILYGDTPLLTAPVLRALIEPTLAARAQLGLLVSAKPDATGYGRILRDGLGRVVGIREQKDCSPAERQITEWNPGIYLISSAFFHTAIGQLNTDNAAGELYLTDLVAIAAKHSQAEPGVVAIPWPAEDLEGINNRQELAAREAVLRKRVLGSHALAGVTIRDPESTYIDAAVTLGEDVIIEPQVHLRGSCHIAARVHIDVGCVLTNVTVQSGTHLRPYTVASDSAIGENARIGPFTHLRPGSQLASDTHVGNFVELKNTRLGQGSKANHLAYLGDGQVGAKVNVGAGVIFCNYDGFNKHQTVLEDGVFVGSDSQLVAPVTVGQGAYIGTGTTITQDVPAEALAIGRARQSNKAGWGSRLRARLQSIKAAQALEQNAEPGKPADQGKPSDDGTP